MTTNTTVLQPPAIHLALPVEKIMGKTITFNSPGTTVALRLGTLPAGAMVVGGGMFVTTAFNGSGNDYIDIGTVADDDAYASDIDASVAGFTVIDNPTNNDYSTSETPVIATYKDANANSSAGSAYVWIKFIEPQG